MCGCGLHLRVEAVHVDVQDHLLFETTLPPEGLEVRIRSYRMSMLEGRAEERPPSQRRYARGAGAAPRAMPCVGDGKLSLPRLSSPAMVPLEQF